MGESESIIVLGREQFNNPDREPRRNPREEPEGTFCARVADISRTFEQ